jgi:hypothetical protein
MTAEPEPCIGPLPTPDDGGAYRYPAGWPRRVYRWPDGCLVWSADNVMPTRWLASWADGTPLRDGEGRTSYFRTVRAAALALTRGGEGPARRGRP